MSKEEWKKTGKELGGAAEGLAKTLIRSAFTGVSKAVDWAEGDKDNPQKNTEESNVFNDGSWRKTGKDLGRAMKDVGKSIMGSAKEASEKTEEWAESKEDDGSKNI